MQPRYICIHGHFYQPPRENAWLESIDIQDSAYPFHDWNERILDECYRPNAAARILDRHDRISRIINNYSRISFNFGPTLLSWMELHAPETYGAILEADRISRSRFDGHGSALAQVYNHPILPLCNQRDRQTQVGWGIADFRARFGRKPDGMWLPETGVDLASLETLAAAGIRYTILAPGQAHRWRPLGSKGKWKTSSDEPLDTRRAYKVSLPSGASIAIFFYDGEISQGIAFGGLLRRGDDLTGKLRSAFSPAARRAGFGRPLRTAEVGEPQLVHVATDGETYGHHHRFGEMALAWTLDRFEKDDEIRLTNYAEFLERHPPRYEAEIHERTAWSCAHGLGRWSEDCGCSTGAGPDWHQRWRAPLRTALDNLRDEVDRRFETQAPEWLTDPWNARDDYIRVILHRDQRTRDAFVESHAKVRGDNEAPSAEDRLQIWGLMELQRQRMLMYTSCAWFFDEVSGIETVQVLQYAARTLQLAKEHLGYDGEAAFLRDLEKAPSNLPENRTAAEVYRRKIRTGVVDGEKVAVNLAASFLIGDGHPINLAAGYESSTEELHVHDNGRRRLALGPVQLQSRVSRERGLYFCAVLHLGDHNLSGGARRLESAEAAAPGIAALRAAFDEGDIPGLLRLLDREFPVHSLAMGDLFRDQQRRLLDRVLKEILEEADAMHRKIYQPNAALLRHLHRLDAPSPPALQVAAERVLNVDLMQAVVAEPFDPLEVGRLLDEIDACGAQLDKQGLGLAASQRIEREVEHFGAEPNDQARLDRLRSSAESLAKLPVDLRLHGAQESFYRLLSRYTDKSHRPAAWREAFLAVAAALKMSTEAL